MKIQYQRSIGLTLALASVILTQSASASRLGANEWVSRDGGIAKGKSVIEQRMSQNGRFIVYTRLDPDSAFITREAFMRDRQTGEISIVATVDQLSDSGNISDVDVSNEGMVVFATNMPLDPVNDVNTNAPFGRNGDVYLTKPGSFSYQLISRIPGGVGGDGVSNQSRISADGKFIAFTSSSTIFNAPNDNNATVDVYRFDVNGNRLELVSRVPNSAFPPPDGIGQAVPGTTGSGRSRNPSISNNGRFVAYETRSTNVTDVVDGNSSVSDVVTRNMDSSANPDNTSAFRAFVSNSLGAISQATMASTNPEINRGDYGTAPTALPTVAFVTNEQLRTSDTDTTRDVYLAVGRTAVHITTSLSAGSLVRTETDVNGLAVVFATDDQYTSDDSNTVSDIYIYSTNDGNVTISDPIVELVSARDATGKAPTGTDATISWRPTVSASGKVVSFITGSTTLNAEKDTNDVDDVYLRDRGRSICDPAFFANKITLDPGKWYQLSLPCNPPAGSTVADILEDDLDSNYLNPSVFDPTVKWAGYTFDPATGAYVVMGPTTELDAKKGFWLLHDFVDPVTLDMPNGSWSQASTFVFRNACKSPEDGCTQLPLSREPVASILDTQWNMLGNPYSTGSGGNDIKMDDLRYHGLSGAGGNSCIAGSSYDGGCNLLDAFANDYLVPIFFSWNADSGSYDVLGRTDTNTVPGLPVPTTNMMSAWEGYWIGELINSSATAASRIIVPEQ